MSDLPDLASEPGPPTLPAPTAPAYVVGVGASAGGLEALSDLLRHVSLERIALVVVQHLSPSHESMLPELLGRATKFSVVAAADGMRLEANHVYVLPPNADLAVLKGVLHLLPLPGGPGPRLPIDFFFRSLAEDQGAAAIGIILSGTGTDGTFGMKAIKAAGGITFVQEPRTARYDGMPQSALASGSADFSLPTKDIAEELRWISNHPVQAQPVLRFAGPAAEEQIAKLFVLIRAEFGNDLSQYKPTTVQRRIERRMSVHKLTRLEDYARLVQSSLDELRALYQDMLITVTSFFRDKEPFAELQSHILPRLLAERPERTPLRAWVPACATGEEVYSVAICLMEYLEDHRLDLKVQLFGTDVDDAAIEVARRGTYPHNIALDVSPERLSRFFVSRDSQYQVSRRIRDAVVFSRHNIFKDPPFSRMDLISCRNLLIYLQPATQKRVLRILHHSLSPSGYLMLGTSESVGDAADLFALADRKSKIYSKKELGGGGVLELGFSPAAHGEAPHTFAVSRPPATLNALVDRKLLELCAPPAVVVDDKLQVLHFRGHTGPYLDPASGNATFDLLRVARPELRVELKRTIQRALESKARAEADVAWHEGGELVSVRLEVAPLRQPEGDRQWAIVLFMPGPPQPAAPSAPVSSGVEADERVLQLERELAATREQLNTALDERSIAEEEFKSATEELQSANEELQSTNEEIETSREEMQSTNEELTTVNEELHNRMAELSVANDDLHNVLLGIEQPVVIVGMDLKIRRYTLAAERLFNLVPEDVGRSVETIERFVGQRELTRMISTVIQTLATAEDELRASNHRWYLLRITPYKTVDHSIRGAVMTLTDIDVRKKATDLSNEVNDYASRHLAGVAHPLVVVDERLRVAWANTAFYSRFQVTPQEILHTDLSSLGSREWFDASIRERILATLEKGTLFRDVPVSPPFPEGSSKAQKIGGSRLPISTGAPMALLSFEQL